MIESVEFVRNEEHRDLVSGLEYEEAWNNRAEDEEPEDEEDDE